MFSLLLPLLTAQVQVDGLRADESLVELAPASAPELAAEESWTYFHGRVVDAMTGLPIAGATVETWSEEITESTVGLRRFGETMTRASGQFRIRVREGDLLSEKARVMAPGYATLSTVTASMADVLELFPLDPAIPRLRFVDAQGQVIANGVITSTRTCAHDLSAFTIHPDALGVFTLSQFAFQDELPELRFLAPGYLGIKYLDGEMLFNQYASRGEVVEVHVPRAAHPRIRLLDEDGSPAAQTLIHMIDEGDHMVARTDQDGRVSLPGRYSTGGITFFRLVDMNRSFGEAAGWMSQVDEEFSLRKDAGIWEDDEELGKIRIELPANMPEDSEVSFDLYHPRGWADGIGERTEPAWESEFPAGEVHMGWGAPFSELLPGHLVLELEEGQQIEVEPKLEFASLIEYTRPEEVSRVWFEVDGASRNTEYNENKVWLPRGRPWKIGLDYQGRSLVLEQPAIDGPGSIDLASLLPKEPQREAMSRVEVRLPAGLEFDPEDWPVARVAGWDGELNDPVATERGWTIEGPAGHQMLTSFYFDGKLDRWLRATFPHEAGATQVVDLALVDAAELELEIPDDWDIAETPLDLDDPLPPGPTEIVVVAPDGRRWGLILDLQPGESRKVTIR